MNYEKRVHLFQFNGYVIESIYPSGEINNRQYILEYGMWEEKEKAHQNIPILSLDRLLKRTQETEIERVSSWHFLRGFPTLENYAQALGRNYINLLELDESINYLQNTSKPAKDSRSEGEFGTVFEPFKNGCYGSTHTRSLTPEEEMEKNQIIAKILSVYEKKQIQQYWALMDTGEIPEDQPKSFFK